MSMAALLLRATVARGLRAPNIVELGNGLGRSSVATGVTDVRHCAIYCVTRNVSAVNVVVCRRVNARHTLDYNLGHSVIKHVRLSPTLTASSKRICRSLRDGCRHSSAPLTSALLTRSNHTRVSTYKMSGCHAWSFCFSSACHHSSLLGRNPSSPSHFIG